MRLIFQHIPKTAGTTVRVNLGQELSKEGIKGIHAYRAAGVAPDAFPDYDLTEDWRFLSGHVPFRFLSGNPKIDIQAKDILLLTFIRDPIDRLISLYNYVALNPKHPQCEEVRAQDGLDYVSAFGGNTQTNFILPPEGMPRPDWKYIIAPVDNVETTCQRVIQLMTGRDVPTEAFVKKQNVTSDRQADFPDFKRLRREDIPQEQLGALLNKHAKDITLYEAAKAAGHLEHLPSR